MLQGAINHSQKCHCVVAPNFLQGAAKSAQKCHGGNAPRERSGTTLRDVNPSPPLPPVLFGAVMTTQQCQGGNAPREGSVSVRRNALQKPPFPTSYRGSIRLRRNAKPMSPPPNLGRQPYAEMLYQDRPITRGQAMLAEMPFCRRLANNKENKWTRDTKTPQSQ